MLLSRRVMLSWITSYLSSSKRISMKNFQLPKFKQNHCRSNIRIKKEKHILDLETLGHPKKKEEKKTVLSTRTQTISFEFRGETTTKTLVDYHWIKPNTSCSLASSLPPPLPTDTWGLQKLRCHALKPPTISSVAWSNCQMEKKTWQISCWFWL